MAACGDPGCKPLEQYAFGVNLVDPVDVYVQANRAVKYALLFVLLGGGLMFAAVAFVVSVVSIPLLLDRNEPLSVAVYTSWRVVLEDPLPMALWAGLIMALALIGMATALTGMIVVLPWLAHASWHAYRDLVQPPDAEA